MFPNIFLITVDDLRADHLGYLGCPKNISPNLDTFAKENIFFSQAMATGPRTILSFPSILYGLYSSEYFITKGYKYKDSLADVLKKIGYKTAAFNSNPHFRLWGFSKGFDFFEDFLKTTEGARKSKVEKIKKGFVKKFGKNSAYVSILTKLLTRTSSKISLPYADAETMTLTVGKWLEEQNKNQPIFCWLHYMDPHYPFIPPNEYISNISQKDLLRVNRLHRLAENHNEDIKKEDLFKLKALYEGEVRYFDKYLGEFFKILKNFKLYRNSIILFAADHGELFGDYGRYGHRYDVLYQKQLHVPLIIKNQYEEKLAIKKPVSLIDIPQTVIDLIKKDYKIFNGKNLWMEKREYVISEGFNWYSFKSNNDQIDTNEMMISCLKENWKIIIDDINKKRELFNLDKDPLESSNLYDNKLKIRSELEKIVDKQKLKLRLKEGNLIERKIKMLKKAGKI